MYNECLISLNGFLEKGLSNTLSLMYSYWWNENVHLKNSIRDDLITSELKKTYISKEMSISMLDAKEYILPQALEEMRN